MAKILIVDDDYSDLERMKKLLTKAGYKAVCVTNGTDALEKVQKNGFGLVLIDILMPSFSGYDLLRLMREKMNSKIKIVYVSIVPKKDADLNKIDGFIQKPFSDAEFVSEVKKFLKPKDEGK